jgi:chorismate mutase/catechol 2,3-dioxygenase-like lactoylglutathione lyase family enzyme
VIRRGGQYRCRMTDLQALRARIDQLDRALIAVVGERLAVCREIAEVKERDATAVIQPARVRAVVASRREQAIAAGIDADFAEQLFRVLLAETHRIEVAGQRADTAPEKTPGNAASALDTVATRIDHVVITVDDVDAARHSLTRRFGFREVDLAGGSAPGMAAFAAGGVTVVIAGPDAAPSVAAYITAHGQGIQHVAIEVLNAGYARHALAASDAPLLTEVVVDDDGHEQFFAAHDDATGVQFGFISRTGHRLGVGASNVLALFTALETT